MGTESSRDAATKAPAGTHLSIVGIEVVAQPTTTSQNGQLKLREVTTRNAVVAADGHHISMEVQGIDADGQPTWTTRSLQISALGADNCSIHFEAHLRCGASTGGKPVTTLFGGCQAWVRADSDIDLAKELLKARVKVALQTMSRHTALADIESDWQLWGRNTKTGEGCLLKTGGRVEICLHAVLLADDGGRDAWVIAPDGTKHTPEALRAAAEERQPATDSERGRERHTG